MASCNGKKDGVIISNDMEVTANDSIVTIVTSQPGVEYNLKFSSVDLHHMGEYSCHVTEADNGDAAIDSDIITLTVYGKCAYRSL